jgi:putative hydrolase
MADDLFSRLFELFNQPGPVNWKLAAEVARHLAGEPQPVDPWAAEQMSELGGLAQQQLESLAPFPVPAAPVAVVDPRQWVEDAMRGFSYLAEAVAEATANTIPGMGAALAGMQVGSLVGTIASSLAGSFESGLPIEGSGPLLLIGPGVGRVEQTSGVDVREVRLWAVASETAHRALFGVPWLTEHLARLFQASAAHSMPDPDQMMELWGGDPTSLAERLTDPAALAQLSGGEEGAAHRQALEAFLAVTSGYRHLLVRRAFAPMLPSLDRLGSPAPSEAPLLSLPISTPDTSARGLRFCTDIEARYGPEVADSIWIDPERLPSGAELDDPVGWAARVLLEEMGADY